jgi:hypothetical protein
MERRERPEGHRVRPGVAEVGRDLEAQVVDDVEAGPGSVRWIEPGGHPRLVDPPVLPDLDRRPESGRTAVLAQDEDVWIGAQAHPARPGRAAAGIVREHRVCRDVGSQLFRQVDEGLRPGPAAVPARGQRETREGRGGARDLAGVVPGGEHFGGIGLRGQGGGFDGEAASSLVHPHLRPDLLDGVHGGRYRLGAAFREEVRLLLRGWQDLRGGGDRGTGRTACSTSCESRKGDKKGQDASGTAHGAIPWIGEKPGAQPAPSPRVERAIPFRGDPS